MGSQTDHVRVYEDDVDRLHDLKNRGDSYADVVRRLLDRHAPLDEQDQETEETEA